MTHLDPPSPVPHFEHDRRLSLLITAILILAGLVSWRLFQKSVVEHAFYVQAASHQYEVAKELPSRRGTIWAQDRELGQLVPLAATEERYDVSVVPRNVEDPDEAASILARHFGLDREETRQKVDGDGLYLSPLVRGIAKPAKEALLADAFTGLLIERHHQRVYPQNQLAAQLLGFVNRGGAGNYGVEGAYDEELRGQAGSVVGQKDTLGRIIDTISRVDPADGVDLELTIDHNVQFAAQERLYRGVEETKASSGQVVILDPNSGELVALAGTPSFDPNKYNEVAKDEQHRFQNPAVSTVYEPGSIMKPLVMAAAINLGKVEPDTQETFGKSVVVQGYEINTALDKAYGQESMTQVLENSDNVGMVWVAGQLANEELRDAFARFGFDEPTGVDLQGETQGSLLPIQDWREIHRATMAFGQGISATPLQVIRAWATLINGGRLVTPHVVRRIVGEQEVTVEADAPVREGVITEETSRKLRGMLQSVVDNGPYGRTRVAGYTVGGKTGTAQIAAPGGGYLEDAFTHSLVGFFPVDEPRYLILVKLDRPQEGKFAESTAGPIFHDLVEYLVNYAKLPPDR